MSDSVVLPALGESVTEGTVTRWLKKIGDSVAIDAVSYTHLTLPTNREV